MSRPIWKGSISFGLVSIPVTLYSAEKDSVIHFKLLDNRNHARIHYQRINEETGKEVPWNDVVKGYEFEKENYVVLDEKDFEKIATENTRLVEIEDFIDQKSLDPVYFEKPYYLVPSKSGQKGYALLHQTLQRTKKIGIAKVMIRTRQYLAAVLPYKNALILNTLRFVSEIRTPKEYDIPESDLKNHKVSPKEIQMAELLVKSMSSKWDPKKYHDKNHEILETIIEAKIHKGKSVTPHKIFRKSKQPKGKLIDFMELLKQSIKEKDKRKGKTHSKSLPSRKKVGKHNIKR